MKLILICIIGAVWLPTVASVFTVSNTFDSGTSSFRQAILDANGNPGFDTIAFDIAGTGIQVITLATLLPTITEAVEILGETQSGYAGTPLIELDGADLRGNGLHIVAGNCTVSALAIHNFITFPFAPRTVGNQILLDTGGGNVISSCYLGLSASGAGPGPLHYRRTGIMIYHSASNQIGHAGSGRNVVSGNGYNEAANIWSLGEDAVGNVIEGNYIGTDPTGSAAENNPGHGVRIDGGVANRIGGLAVGAANVISGNGSNGVHLIAGAAFNLVEQNFIGTDRTGALPVPNRINGVEIQNASTNTIHAGNVICANLAHGILVRCPISAPTDCSQGNIIANNSIGYGTGGAPLGNGQNGILVTGAATEGNLIGLPGEPPNNIYYNSVDGIGIEASRNPVSLNQVNSNTRDGINVTSGFNNINKNTSVLNGRDGLRVAGSNNQLFENNFIGNFHNGLSVVMPGLANTIRYNSITGNEQLGIDLMDDGLTLNDPPFARDADGGANLRQNWPIIEHSSHDDSNLYVSGWLDSKELSAYTLDFYLSPNCDYPLNSGEGYTHVGEAFLLTDVNGHGIFTATFPINVTSVPGWFVTATATAGSGDTSEFSYCNYADFGVRLRTRRVLGGIELFWRDHTFPWRLQSGPLPGPNFAWQDMTNKPVELNGEFIVTDKVESEAKLYRLRRMQPPVITQQPQSLTVTQGDAGTFIVKADGLQPMSFLWFHSNAPVAGGSADSLTISNAQPINAGPYSVQVSNVDGTVFSTNATLTIK